MGRKKGERPTIVKILRIISSEPATKRQLIALIGVSDQTVANRLSALTALGLVLSTRTNGGRGPRTYQISKTGRYLVERMKREGRL